MRYCLYFIFLTLISPELLAAGLFEPSPDDKSLEYLGKIFSIGEVTSGDLHHAWFALLFDKFNWLILSAAVFIVSYVGITSTINTAQEGEVMGKKWSSIWIPLRTALGLILITPTFGSGYSLIQSSVMWIVVSGVGAADSLWNVVADNFYTGTGPVQIDNISTLKKTSRELTKFLLRSAVCLESINKYLPQGYTAEFYQSVSATESFTENRGYKGVMWNVGVRKDESEDKIYKSVCGQYNISAEIYSREYSDITDLEITDVTKEMLEFSVNKIYEAKVDAVEIMFGKLRGFAKDIIDEKVQPRDTKYPSYSGKGRLQYGIKYSPARKINEASTLYVDKMSQLATVRGTQVIGYQDGDYVKPTSADLNMDAIIASAKGRGWISAGEYYYALNKARTAILWDTCSENFKKGTKPPSFSFGYNETEGVPFPKNEKEFLDALNKESEKKKNAEDGLNGEEAIAASKDDNAFVMELGYLKDLFLENSSNEGQSKTNLGKTAYAIYDSILYYNEDVTDRRPIVALNDEENKYGNGLFAPLQDALESIDPVSIIKDKLTGENGDILVSISKFGDELMTIAETMVLLMIPIIIALGLALSGVVSIFWWGPVFSPAPVMQVALPVFFFIASIAILLWTIGATFAVYVPLVPYMIYIAGVLGWYIAVVEAIIAAPILAMGLVIPSSDEIGKIAPGLAILANIFLRPMLMVLGFVIAALVLRVIVGIVNESIAGVFDSMRKDSTALLTPIVQLIVYAVFIVSLVNKCFDLIHILPDKILRWIGGTTENIGQSSSEILRETKSGTESGTGAMSDTMGGLAESGEKKAMSDNKKAMGSTLSMSDRKDLWDKH